MTVQLKTWRVEVWVGESGDHGAFMGEPTMTMESVASFTKGGAERRARHDVSRSIQSEAPFTLVAEATEVEG